jgi:hypothetical protein
MRYDGDDYELYPYNLDIALDFTLDYHISVKLL